MQPSAAVRFEAGWVPEPNTGCFLWFASRDRDGYGWIRFDGKNGKAHRLAWQLAHGPIPQGLAVCHRCDTPECVNADHLFLGTNTENAYDRHRKKRDAVGDRNGARVRPERLARGDRNGARLHRERMPRGERHGMAVLSAEQVREIRRRSAGGEPTTVIAVSLGISYHTVWDIIRRRHWSHLP